MPDPAPHLPGDEAHARFLVLYTRHQRELRAYVAAVMTDWADVDEVLQETCLVLWSKFDQFVPGSNFPAWACAIAHRKALRRRRDRGRDRHQFVAEFEDAALAAAERADGRGDRLRALTRCVEKLPPADRDLVETCYAGPGGIRRAADARGRPAKAVYKWLARVRKGLLECVERTLRAEGAG